MAAGKMRATVLLLSLSGLVTGCTSLTTPTCSPGAQSSTVAELVFGRNVGNQIGVTKADWSRFLDEEVTPRFPDGLTVYDANGQWRDAERGSIVQEPSKVLVIVLGDQQRDKARIDEIAGAYKRKFQQQAVLTMLRPACVSF